ncbi:unnamed protein product, partial [Mesorhabditis belari]|uniref:RING-type E3 ubiquitin transferase n=1 Tax=Mesorhabditis belari TaxID=2138241 RepID=A0AAF3EWL6_9BILA
MSNPIYFCHQCNHDVRSRESDLKCAECGGEFIEEIERPPFQLHFAGNPAPQTDRPRVATARSRPYPPQDHPRNQQPPQAMAFGPLNDLMSMFIPGGRPPQAQQHRPQPPQPRLRPRSEGAFVLSGRPPHPPPNPADAHQHAHNHAHVHAVPPQLHDSINHFMTQLLSGLGAEQQNFRVRLVMDGDGSDGGAHMFPGNFADFEQMQLDQIVTNLLNSFENGAAAAAGLSPEEVARIPRVKVNQKHVDNDTQCTTCMESFKKDETVLELNCRHIFHQDCLVPWFERHRTCPICRQEVDPSTFPDASSESTQPSAPAPSSSPSAPAAHGNLQHDMDLD